MEPDDDRTEKLLEEIRDAQREHLAEYRRVTQQSLDLQQRALDRQQELGRLYKRIVMFGGVLFVVLMILLLYLLVRWSHYLFR
jgi:ferric-dicitrate binding protein FerR (iron transport regulator)